MFLLCCFLLPDTVNALQTVNSVTTATVAIASTITSTRKTEAEQLSPASNETRAPSIQRSVRWTYCKAWFIWGGHRVMDNTLAQSAVWGTWFPLPLKVRWSFHSVGGNTDLVSDDGHFRWDRYQKEHNQGCRWDGQHPYTFCMKWTCPPSTFVPKIYVTYI